MSPLDWEAAEIDEGCTQVPFSCNASSAIIR